MDITTRLDKAIKAVCPIDGVAVDVATGKIRVDYKAEATDEQIAAAKTVIDGFDPSDAATAIAQTESKAAIDADSPMLVFLLGQLQKSIPSYVPPDRDTIIAELKSIRSRT